MADTGIAQSHSVHVGYGDGGESDYPYNTVADIKSALDKLEAAVATAWTEDKIEGDDALKRAEGDCVADKDYFRKRIGEIETRKNNALKGIQTLFTSHYEPKKDVITSLMEDYSKKWSDMGLKVDELRSTIQKHVELDDWSSAGAKDYKQAAVNQSNAMAELQQLSFNSSDAVSQVAQVNAAIFNSTTESIMTVVDAIDVSPAKTGEDYYSRSYYVRSDSAAAKLEGLNTWMSKVVTTNGEWGSTAYDIGSAIDSVRQSPANLKSGGVWPEAKSGAEVASSTDEMASNTQQNIDASSGAGSGKGTLDK